MLKRLTAILLALGLAVGAAACGDKKAGENEKIPTLTWYVPGDKQSDIASVMEKVNEITVPAIGAKLNLEFIDTSAYEQRMKMNMAAGAEYDLCFTGWINKYADAVKNGGLLEITELLDKTPELKKSLPQYAWDAATVNGKIYGVPNLQTFALPEGIVVLKEVADKYDFDFSKVRYLEDIEPFLAMVKEGEPDKFPFRCNWGIGMFVSRQYENISSDVVIDRDGKNTEVYFGSDSEIYKKGMETYKRWFEQGYIRPDMAGLSDDTIDYKAGKYVVSCEGWKPGVESDVKNDIGKEVISVVLNTPYMLKDGGVRTMISIGNNCKYPEKALKFIELINTDKELYNLVGFGIEGKHYKLNEDGKVTYIENGGYTPKMQWKFGNQFNALLLEGQEDDVWEKTMELNDEAVKSPLMGFTLDTDPIRSEISQISAVEKNYTIWQYSEELWAERARKLDQAGRQKVKEEIQRQVDEFLKNKQNK